MLKNNRKGFVGLMLTIALGVAVGAATLVASKETAKSLATQNKPATPVPSPKTLIPSSPQAKTAPLSKAEIYAKKFMQTQKNYYQSIASGQVNAKSFSQNVKEAQADFEQAKKGLTANSETKSSEIAPVSAPEGVQQRNPFLEGGTNVKAAANSGNTAETALAVAVESSPTPLSLEYYRVKSGDCLYDICQRYYGDGGMWSHILTYQIPSIVSCPNLIFPGQLIALPRTLTAGSQGASSSSSSGSVTKPAATGNSPLQAAPKGDESWSNNFQKDNLISDFSLTNTNTMTVSQIQAFLDQKGSVLAKPYRGSTPSQMIYNAAKKYGINPQVLLTRLQCEQGLISKKSATEKELDWALGVGAYDSGNWNQNYKGFDKQVEGAAQTYQRHYLDAKARLDRGERVTMTIDGQSVEVKNASTYAFYKYCPHFNGNKLFYDVWRGYSGAW